MHCQCLLSSSDLSTPYKGYFVDIGNHANLNNNRIWTIELGPKQTAERPADVNEDQVEEKLPLVLVHGFGAGVGIWSLNLDALSVDRKVYAFDLLGFARSSRPAFDFCNSEEVEWQLIQAIEKWRVEMKLDQKFVLLGHSFGGYLAAAYALNFPHHVGHLILADPWGMPSIQTQQGNTTSTAQYQIPVWVKVVATVVFSTFTPLSVLRGAGPWGPTLVHKFRPDLKKKFEGLIGAEDSDLILNYVYHCNAQDNPSGEKAFKALAQKAGWAKFPIIQRIGELHPDIELTFIYGSRSWIDRQPGFQIKYLLRDRLVDIHVIQGAGHHVYADKHTTFNGETLEFLNVRIN